jgi:HYR domain
MRPALSLIALLCALFVLPSESSASCSFFLPNPLLHADASHCDINLGCERGSTDWNPGNTPPARADASASGVSSFADMQAGATDAEVNARASSDTAYAKTSADVEIIDTFTISGPATVDLVGRATGQTDSHIDLVSSRASLSLDAKIFLADPASCPAPDFVCDGPEYASSLQRPGAVDDPIDVTADLAAGTYVVDVEAKASADDELAQATADVKFHLVVPSNVSASSGSGLLPIQGGAPPANTPVGTLVAVHPVDPASGAGADVTFDSVTAAGNTTLTSSSTGPQLPSGFQLSGGLYFDLSTTAAWSGSAIVCFPYLGPMPELFHHDSSAGGWVDVTDATLSTASRVCGRVSSFSPFATATAPADTTPPMLHLPANVTAVATSPGGAVVNYTATATDNLDANASAACTPASGATFAIGTTTVNCTSTDHTGNTARGSFTVTVKGAKDQLNNLIQKVVNYSSLPTATKTQLIGSLQSLVASFDPTNASQKQIVCGALKLFVAALQYQSGKALPASVAADWIADATRIRAVLAC